MLNFNNDAFKTSLKKMAVQAVRQVEPARECGDEPLHRRGQVGRVGFEQQMIMVAHQDVGMHLDPEALGQLPQQLQEQFPVAIRTEDILAGVSPGHHMINCPGKRYSPLACHEPVF